MYIEKTNGKIVKGKEAGAQPIFDRAINIKL